MKTLIIIFSLIIIVNLKVSAQIIDSGNVHFELIYEMPNFPGGPDSIWCFLESNFKYDILNAGQKKVSYNAAFYFDSLGIARDFKIFSTRPEIENDHLDSLKRNEILRVLGLMPKWEVPKYINKKIKNWVYIPIMTPYKEFRCKKKIENNSH
jgi:hypothetical protein